MATNNVASQNTIINNQITNTTGANGYEPLNGAYQAGFSVYDNTDTVTNNFICGIGYTPVATPPPYLFYIDNAGTIALKDQYNLERANNCTLQANVTLTSSVNPAEQTKPTTLTASVASADSSGPTPTGTVQFYNGSTPIGSSQNWANTPITQSFPDSLQGTYNITAVYSGDNNFPQSTSPVVNQVVNNDLHPVLECVANNGDSTYTAHFGYQNSLGTSYSIPTDNSNGNNFFTPTLQTNSLPKLVNGTTQPTTLQPGRVYDNFQVMFNGSNLVWNLMGNTATASSSSTACNSGVVTSATTVASSVNPTVFGQSTTFTATVVGSDSAPVTGTVDFYSGSTKLGTGTLNGSGTATYVTSALSAGTHSITAKYSGNGTFPSSTSSVLSQVVNQASTSTSVTTSLTPSVSGQNVTFTATVAVVAPGAGTPTGVVTFKNGSTTLGTGTVNGSGIAAFSTTALPVGSLSIAAVYGGDTNFLTSTGNVSQVVDATPPPPVGASNAYIRIVESSEAYSSVDVAIDGKTSFPNVQSCSVGGYVPVGAGSHTFTFYEPSGGSQLLQYTGSFTAGSYYTLALVGNSSLTPALAPGVVSFNDDQTLASGQAKVRVYNLSDVLSSISYTGNGTQLSSGLAFESASGYAVENPGTFSLVFTKVGSPSTTFSTTLNLAANQVYSVFVDCNGQVNNTVASGTPTGVPQTGSAVGANPWNTMGLIASILLLLAGLAGLTYNRWSQLIVKQA